MNTLVLVFSIYRLAY